MTYINIKYGRCSNITARGIFWNFLNLPIHVRVQLIQKHCNHVSVVHKHSKHSCFISFITLYGSTCYVVDTVIAMYKQVKFASVGRRRARQRVVGARAAHCRPSVENKFPCSLPPAPRHPRCALAPSYLISPENMFCYTKVTLAFVYGNCISFGATTKTR